MIKLPNGWEVKKKLTDLYDVYRSGTEVAFIYMHLGSKTWRLVTRNARIGIDLGSTWQDVEQNLQPTLAALIVRGEI